MRVSIEMDGGRSGQMALFSGNSGTAGRRAEIALIQAQVRRCFQYRQKCVESSTKTEVEIEKRTHLSKHYAFGNKK
jgi:hypothetical protein